MEVKTKSSVEEITIVLTPRDFSSVKSLVDLNNRINAIFNDMIPAKVRAEYGEWCKQQIVQQMEQHMNPNDRKEKCEKKDQCEQKSYTQMKKEAMEEMTQKLKSKHHTATFTHLTWDEAQQLQTLAKRSGIKFGQIQPE